MDNKNDQDQAEHDIISLMIIGDQAVGKTSLLMRFTDDKFNSNIIGTAGVDFRRKQLSIEGKMVKIIVYDTAGHERFYKLSKNFYKHSKGIILVYDVTDKKSFDNLKNWISSIQENSDNNVDVLIVGNKIDLEKSIPTEEGRKISINYNSIFMETSAKTGENVEESFLTLLKNIIKNDTRIPTENNIIQFKIPPEKNKKKKATLCCHN